MEKTAKKRASDGAIKGRKMQIPPMPHGNTGKTRKKAGGTSPSGGAPQRSAKLPKIAVGPRMPVLAIPDAKASLDAMRNGAAVHGAGIGERIVGEANRTDTADGSNVTNGPSAGDDGPIMAPLRAEMLPCGKHWVVKSAAGRVLSTQCTKALAEAIVEAVNGAAEVKAAQARKADGMHSSGGAPQEEKRMPVAVEGVPAPVVKGRYFCDWIPVWGDMGGHFRIADADDNMIAGCYVEANARLVTAALNAYVVAPVCPSLDDVHAAEREQAAALQGKKVVWG